MTNILDRMRQELDTAFDRLVPNRRADESWDPTAFFRGGYPALDVEDQEDKVIVTAELPGMNKEDFQVEITGSRLVLRGEKKCQRENQKRNLHTSECTYGAFRREITLPAEVVAERADASFKNGVLIIELPKSESARSHKINVQVD